MAFKYTLNFVTAADLAGAVAAEKAVAKVGTAADEAGDKLDKLAESGKELGDGLAESLGEAGEKGGESAAGGVFKGILGADAIGKAWEFGSLIGAKLGEGIAASWEASAGEGADAFWAAMGSGSAQARIAGADYAQEMMATMKSLNVAMAAENKKFWDEYNNSLPKNAGDWLKEIGEQADAAKAKLTALAEIQNAVLKQNKTRAEQDHLDEKLRIELDPTMSKSQKLEATAANDARKEQIEADLRKQDRRAKAALINDGVGQKASEVEALQKAEAEQKARAEAQVRADNAAKAAIVAASVGGNKPSDEDKTFFTQQAYDAESKKSGVSLTVGRDEKAQAEKTQAELDKTKAELVKLQSEAAAKKNALKIDQQTDDEATSRSQKRNQVSSANKVESQRRIEWSESDAERAKQSAAMESEAQRAEDLKKAQDAEAAKLKIPPGQEQTSPESTEDMREKLRIMSQTTGDAGLRMALETLKNKLSDGGSAAELKEAAALMERAQADRNDAVRQMSQAMRSVVESQNAALKEMKAEVAALRASQEAFKQRS